MISYTDLITAGAVYLKRHDRCPKHHVTHTGSTVYLLDFYTATGDIDAGVQLIDTLLERIVADGDAYVFYPGRLDPMNMSNSVIDTGAAVDAIARFVTLHTDAFSEADRARIIERLRTVVDTYLNRAALEKPITNQRLWGLTGVASFARLVGEENRFADMAHASIARAFEDMLPDGFFRYYPDAPKYDAFAGYDGMTTFYQSRHIAFIVYALDTLGLSRAPYQARLDQATRALLSMYRSEGYKDMRMECKRWYWQSPYEVASHGFDAYALATSDVPGTQTALTNVLHLIRTHARSGYLRSDLGPDINFQCPIFWTAHLAWMLRIEEAQQRFDGAAQIVPFTYEFKGEQVYTYTAPGERVLVNGYDGLRNPTVGIIEHSSIDSRGRWRATLPALPPALFESVREVANHTWYALRGFHLHEAVVRIACFMRDLFVMLLPRYTARYGKIERITYDERGQQVSITVALRPATKYGDLFPHTELFTLNPYA